MNGRVCICLVLKEDRKLQEGVNATFLLSFETGFIWIRQERSSCELMNKYSIDTIKMTKITLPATCSSLCAKWLQTQSVSKILAWSKEYCTPAHRHWRESSNITPADSSHLQSNDMFTTRHKQDHQIIVLPPSLTKLCASKNCYGMEFSFIKYFVLHRTIGPLNTA